MSRVTGRFAGWALAWAAVLGVAAPARAFWEWDIKEIFSSADGTVQFIELFTPVSASQHLLNGHTITATSDGVLKTLTLGGPLPAFSGSKHLLFATSGFASLTGGVAHDYNALPANFFNPNAASITFNWGHDTDIVTLAGSQIPKDGVNSLNEANPADPGQVFVAGTNSPTNFAGASGSVNLGGGMAAPGDFDGNGTVNGADLTRWRTNFGSTAAPTVAQGNADGDGDVDGSDFLVWQRNLGSGVPAVRAAASIPEPSSLAVVVGVLLSGFARGFARSRRYVR